jgi:AcrR family transcriptional regulator
VSTVASERGEELVSEVGEQDGRSILVKDDGPEPQKRARTADRRRQIVQVTLRLIAQEGLAGVRLAQIAAELGVTDAALYKHFPSKDDILIAAYDTLAKRVFDWLSNLPGETALDRLRAVGLTHAEVSSRDLEGFNIPMSQFNVWIPRDRVHAHVDQTHGEIRGALAQILEDGKADGSMRPDFDTDVVVSEIYAWIWWEDFSHLRGLDPERLARGSAEMFGKIVAWVAAEGS